jgi:hypothetical protein
VSLVSLTCSDTKLNASKIVHVVILYVILTVPGMTKIKMSKDEGSTDFVEKRRASLERCAIK